MDQSQSNPESILTQIVELQNTLGALRTRRSELEDALAMINQDIDEDIRQVTALREQLDAVIAAGTRKAVED